MSNTTLVLTNKKGVIVFVSNVESQTQVNSYIENNNFDMAYIVHSTSQDFDLKLNDQFTDEDDNGEHEAYNYVCRTATANELNNFEDDRNEFLSYLN